MEPFLFPLITISRNFLLCLVEDLIDNSPHNRPSNSVAVIKCQIRLRQSSSDWILNSDSGRKTAPLGNVPEGLLPRSHITEIGVTRVNTNLPVRLFL